MARKTKKQAGGPQGPKVAKKEKKELVGESMVKKRGGRGRPIANAGTSTNFKCERGQLRGSENGWKGGSKQAIALGGGGPVQKLERLKKEGTKRYAVGSGKKGGSGCTLTQPVSNSADWVWEKGQKHRTMNAQSGETPGEKGKKKEWGSGKSAKNGRNREARATRGGAFCKLILWGGARGGPEKGDPPKGQTSSKK